MHDLVTKQKPYSNSHNIARYCLYAAILAAVACASFWGARRITSSSRAQARDDKIDKQFKLIQWGAIPAPIQLTSAQRRIVNIPSPDRYTIVQYIARENPRTQQVILYAQYLCHDRFLDTVNYVVVVNPSESGLISALSKLRIPNLDLYVDRDHRYVQHFSLPTNLDSAIAVDKSGVVRFSALGLVMQDALRVLISRYSGWDNDRKYSEDLPMRPYHIGEQVPPFEIQDIRSGRTFSSQALIEPTEHHLWIFTADCAMCSLPSYLRKYVGISDPTSIPIFSSRIPITVLESNAQEAGYHGPLYVATEEIPIFEDLLYNRSLTPYAAIVDISKDGRLSKVTSLTPF